MDASSEFAEFLHRHPELIRRLAQDLCQVWVGSCVSSSACGVERERQREQPLLCAVVEVAFHSPTFRVGSRNDAGPRCMHLLELCPDFGLQVFVLDRHASGCADRTEQLTMFDQGRIVDERDETLAVAMDDGDPRRV